MPPTAEKELCHGDGGVPKTWPRFARQVQHSAALVVEGVSLQKKRRAENRGEEEWRVAAESRIQTPLPDSRTPR
jgi:hypothetical protein